MVGFICNTIGEKDGFQEQASGKRENGDSWARSDVHTQHRRSKRFSLYYSDNCCGYFCKYVSFGVWGILFAVLRWMFAWTFVCYLVGFEDFCISNTQNLLKGFDCLSSLASFIGSSQTDMLRVSECLYCDIGR